MVLDCVLGVLVNGVLGDGGYRFEFSGGTDGVIVVVILNGNIFIVLVGAK